MSAIDGVMKSVCPSYGTIKQGMRMLEKPKKPSKLITGNKTIRLTSKGNDGKPGLATGVTMQQAVKKLFDFEELGMTPYEVCQLAGDLVCFEELGLTVNQIRILIEREKALTERVKKMEGW